MAKPSQIRIKYLILSDKTTKTRATLHLKSSIFPLIDNFTHRRIQCKRSDIDDSRRRLIKMLNIFNDNLTVRVRFYDFEADSIRVSCQNHSEKSQTCHRETADFRSHIMEDGFCAAKINKIGTGSKSVTTYSTATVYIQWHFLTQHRRAIVVRWGHNQRMYGLLQSGSRKTWKMPRNWS